jgi:hypothetical protein
MTWERQIVTIFYLISKCYMMYGTTNSVKSLTSFSNIVSSFQENILKAGSVEFYKFMEINV